MMSIPGKGEGKPKPAAKETKWTFRQRKAGKSRPAWKHEREIHFRFGLCRRHPGRGTCLPKFFTGLSGIVEGINGVQIGPGATALARMPFFASICARPPMKFWIAPFVVAYASSQVAGHQYGFPACFLDEFLDLVRFFGLIEKRQDVRAFARERDRDRSPYSAVAASDDGLHPFQLA
jgi:hypothetical protein